MIAVTILFTIGTMCGEMPQVSSTPAAPPVHADPFLAYSDPGNTHRISLPNQASASSNEPSCAAPPLDRKGATLEDEPGIELACIRTIKHVRPSRGQPSTPTHRFGKGQMQARVGASAQMLWGLGGMVNQ